MIKKLIRLYAFCGVPAIWVHELSHLIFALIFRTEIKEVNINYRYDSKDLDSDILISGNVVHSGQIKYSRIANTLVSVAPLFSFAGLLLYTLLNRHYLCYAYIVLYWHFFFPSRDDLMDVKDNILNSKRDSK